MLKTMISPEGVRYVDRLCFGGLRFEELAYDAGHTNPLHHHDQAFLDVSLEGLIQGRWKGQSVLRSPASVTYLPVGESHAMAQDGPTRTFQVVIPTKWLASLDATERICFVEGKLANWKAASLYRAFKNRDDLSAPDLEGLLSELLVLMFGRGEREAGSHRPGWFAQAEEFVRTYFREPITPESVAAAVGVHPAYLMRQFREHLGCTLGDHIRTLRVQYARKRLTSSDASLAEIAYDAGFSDQSHFNRVFRRYYGTSPGEYRQATL